MPYKTICIKLLKPSTKKREMLDIAIKDYKQAFALLHNDYEKQKVTLKEFLSKEQMCKVDQFNAQPFKDALKKDITLLNAMPTLTKYDKNRHLLFSRYSSVRDYSILKHETSGTFYAKLYIKNRTGALDNSNNNTNLFDISPPFEQIKQSTKVRYLLLPLVISQYHLNHLNDISSGLAKAKSALLIKRKDEYYLHMRLWYEDFPQEDYLNYLGVARGINQELFLALCNKNGQGIKTYEISEASAKGKNKMHSLANNIISIAIENKCKIILANLRKTGDCLTNSINVKLSTEEYRQICDIIKYKAMFAKLAEPVEVSAWHLYSRCSVCGITHKTNRFNHSILCVGCGAYHELSYNAAVNLAKTLIRYNNQKLPVIYSVKDNKINFNLKLLKFEFACSNNNFSIEKFLNKLEYYVKSEPKGLTIKQYSIINKINSAKDLQECLAFIEI